ncbi:MAG: NAD(P)-binding domain-containing protein [Patescibacteria group bacterium]|nr:NAD(P)-binding domain-containing protein [Patescibacteria group bacterium]
MAKIVFFEVENWEEDYVKNGLLGLDTVITSEKLDAATISKYQDTEIISCFIYSTLTYDILGKLPNLKFIATRSTGFDHIDLSYCKKKNILVANIPTYGAHTVAEHTFALILAISRKIIPSIEQAKKGDFSSEGLEGFDLFGKTLGVLGTGNIGRNVALLGLSFGMKVLAHSRSEDKELVSKGAKYVSLDELLANSDIVSLHLPHSKETEHIINLQNLEKIKKGAVLINTARGALVETQALVEGLEKGILSGVGLDVLEEEAFLKEERELLSTEYLNKIDVKTELLNHVLLTRTDVIITPHNAFNSKEAVEEILATTVSNIKTFLEGEPQNLVS